jgi:predicted CXXCH cytochrome family protein
LGCHDLTAHAHGLDAERGAERYPLSTSFPNENGTYRCEVCHRPHASDRSNLWVDRESLCSSDCHRL